MTFSTEICHCHKCLWGRNLNSSSLWCSVQRKSVSVTKLPSRTNWTISPHHMPLAWKLWWAGLWILAYKVKFWLCHCAFWKLIMASELKSASPIEISYWLHFVEERVYYDMWKVKVKLFMCLCTGIYLDEYR